MSNMCVLTCNGVLLRHNNHFSIAHIVANQIESAVIFSPSDQKKELI